MRRFALVLVALGLTVGFSACSEESADPDEGETTKKKKKA
jgi:hypothetical protein